jgi:hypothetical protein
MLTTDDRQVEKRLRQGLVLSIRPNQDQAIIDLIIQHFPDVQILYRTVDSQPLWIQRGRPPMEAR